MHLTRLVVVLFLWGTTLLFATEIVGENVPHVKIAAFNIQVFGVKKAGDENIMRHIVKIIQRYDLVLIQEIRDKSQTAMIKLLDQLKQAKTPYRMHLSKRLGRTTSKEQYAFLSRIGSQIKYEDSFTYEDGSETQGTDTFQREPFVVRFSFQNLPFKYISFISIHTDPDTAVSELQHLSDVYKKTLERWGNNEIIIMGDFNADCSYVAKKSWPTIPLRTDSKFYWPLGDEVDTTVSNSNCAYDRFVIAGQKLINLATDGKVSVFRFDEEFGLDSQTAKSVSDHYPIELFLPVTETNKIPSSSNSVNTKQQEKSSVKEFRHYIQELGNRVRRYIESKVNYFKEDRLELLSRCGRLHCSSHRGRFS